MLSGDMMLIPSSGWVHVFIAYWVGFDILAVLPLPPPLFTLFFVTPCRGNGFALSQMLSEATEDNLIDLGPGSPAVVSPRISATPPTSLPASVLPARSASPATLSSRLAGLGESSTGTTRPALSVTTGDGTGNQSDFVICRRWSRQRQRNPELSQLSPAAGRLWHVRPEQKWQSGWTTKKVQNTLIHNCLIHVFGIFLYLIIHWNSLKDNSPLISGIFIFTEH